MSININNIKDLILPINKLDNIEEDYDIGTTNNAIIILYVILIIISIIIFAVFVKKRFLQRKFLRSKNQDLELQPRASSPDHQPFQLILSEGTNSQEGGVRSPSSTGTADLHMFPGFLFHLSYDTRISLQYNPCILLMLVQLQLRDRSVQNT